MSVHKKEEEEKEKESHFIKSLDVFMLKITLAICLIKNFIRSSPF